MFHKCNVYEWVGVSCSLQSAKQEKAMVYIKVIKKVFRSRNIIRGRITDTQSCWNFFSKFQNGNFYFSFFLFKTIFEDYKHQFFFCFSTFSYLDNLWRVSEEQT